MSFKVQCNVDEGHLESELNNTQTQGRAVVQVLYQSESKYTIISIDAPVYKQVRPATTEEKKEQNERS